MKIGKKIRLLRVEKELTIRELAKKSGISHQALSNYEHGINNPGSDKLEKLASALGINISVFHNDFYIGINPEKLMESFNGQSALLSVLNDIDQKIDRMLSEDEKNKKPSKEFQAATGQALPRDPRLIPWRMLQ